MKDIKETADHIANKITVMQTNVLEKNVSYSFLSLFDTHKGHNHRFSLSNIVDEYKN